MRDLQAARGTTLNRQRRALRLLAGGIALLGIGLDQIVKWASLAFLEKGEPVPLVGSLLQLNLIFNPGAAFGMGEEFTVVFTSFAIIALLGCLVYAMPRVTELWQGIVLGLFMAGIAGNLVDRIIQPPKPFYGHVVDMFHLNGFAIFNVADVFITAAAVFIVIHTFLTRNSEAAADS